MRAGSRLLQQVDVSIWRSAAMKSLRVPVSPTIRNGASPPHIADACWCAKNERVCRSGAHGCMSRAGLRPCGGWFTKVLSFARRSCVRFVVRGPTCCWWSRLRSDSRPALFRAFYRLEAAAYRHAAMVSTLTEAMRGRIIAKRVPPEKVVLFSDWVEPGLFKIPPPPVRPDRGSAGEFVVAHFGNMGVKQGLEIVVEAARLSAAEKAITYLLVGDG